MFVCNENSHREYEIIDGPVFNGIRSWTYARDKVAKDDEHILKKSVMFTAVKNASSDDSNHKSIFQLDFIGFSPFEISSVTVGSCIEIMTILIVFNKLINLLFLFV